MAVIFNTTTPTTVEFRENEGALLQEGTFTVFVVDDNRSINCFTLNVVRNSKRLHILLFHTRAKHKTYTTLNCEIPAKVQNLKFWQEWALTINSV